METDKYYAEIAKQAALLKQEPARFHSSVRSWILLGYILLFFVLIALVAMLVIAIFLYRVPKLAFFVGAAGFIGLAGFVMAMFTKLNDTNAIEFNRAEAPEIWKRLDHFCQKAGLKKVDKLLLDDDFNASASLQGRFIFGPQKVVVTLGVPFLSLHSPEEVDAVLVHELAHHINKDTNISHRSYRIGLLWGGLAENSSGLTKWIDWLATWYWRTLSAKRDVSSRPAEFAADKLAAEIVGQEAMQGTLVRTPVNATTRYQVVTDAMAELARRGEPIEPHYATNIHKLAKVDMEDPPFDEIMVELRKHSHENDSHPSLRERLANIGVNIDPEDLTTIHSLAERYAAPLQTTALEAYFPGSHTAVLERFDKQFVARYSDNWNLMSAQGKEESAALQELEQKRSTAPLTLEEELKYLELKAESNQLESVAEEVTALYQNNPDNKEVLTLYARLKLEQKDPSCLDLLKRLENDPEYRLASFSLASNYYSSIGDSQNEREYQIKAAREYEALGKAYEQLNSETLGTVLPLDLSEDLRKKAIQAAQNDDEIQAVYAITRFHEDAPHVKQPLLIVHTKYKGVVLDENKRLTQILDRFDKATQATKEGIGIQVLPNINVWVKQINKLGSPGLAIYKR